MSIQDRIINCQQRVNAALLRYLPPIDSTPARFNQALHYVVFNGGKRLRPTLAYFTANSLGLKLDNIDAIACSLELIHCYSLVHDDLPAMDDDNLRRGKPTCHKAFDEATAVLVGDALQTLAFELLAHHDNSSISESSRLQIIRTLAEASGCNGMVKGQAIDMAAVGKALNQEQLEQMHKYKTGALIKAAVIMSALTCPDISKPQLNALAKYSEAIGLAFQVQDDILDVISSTEVLGKTQGQDANTNKPTYPSIIGLDAAKTKAKSLCIDAKEHLSIFDNKADDLRDIADFIVERVN